MKTYTEYAGIDYGRGLTNIDKKNIRFGVLPFHEILQAWCDDSESEYGFPFCEHCGYEFKTTTDPKLCPICRQEIIEPIWRDEPLFHYYRQNGYKIYQPFDDTDLFIEKSPFFTFAQFCSPCAPGACYLLNPLNPKEASKNNICYCLDHKWFENKKAPYPVFTIKTGKEVKA